VAVGRSRPQPNTGRRHQEHADDSRLSTDEKLQPSFRWLVGKIVTAHGNPFAALAAHHHAPIVIDVTEISP